MQPTSIDQQIESKDKALINLNQKLNDKRLEVDNELKKLEQLKQQKEKEFFEEVEKLKVVKENPELTVAEIRGRLKVGERRLELWHKELNELTEQVTKTELEVVAREKVLAELEDTLRSEWLEMIGMTESKLRLEWDSLVIKTNLLEARNREVDRKQNRLNDQIRSFKAAQKELDGKRER